MHFFLKVTRRQTAVKAARRLAAAVMMTGALLTASLSAYAQEDVPITCADQVVDEFQGITANYMPGLHNTNRGAYCCAGYVIKFYKDLYGVDTFNVNTVWGKPTVEKEGSTVELVEVDVPQPGDMMQSLTYSHVGIVKDVVDDRVILIEQNYKWWNGGTVATVERELGFDDAHYYRLIIDGEEMVYETGSSTAGAAAKAEAQAEAIAEWEASLAALEAGSVVVSDYEYEQP